MTRFMTNDQAITLLLDILEEDKESDVTSILERWRTAVDNYEADQQEQRQAQLPPMRYGIVHGVIVEATNDASHQFYQYAPDARYVVERADLPEFAREHGLSLDRLMSVLEGHTLDERGFRSWWLSGGMSKPYTPPREPMSDEERRQEVGRRFTKDATSFVPSTDKPAYRAMPEPEITMYNPNKKDNN